MIDDRRVQRKDSFHADSETGLAHRDRFARAAMFAGDTDAFKGLQPFFGFRFLYANVNAYGISRLKLRNVIA